jgi:hypothetical protein
MEVSVRQKVQALKPKLQPKVAAAGVNVANMKLKVQNTGGGAPKQLDFCSRLL